MPTECGRKEVDPQFMRYGSFRLKNALIQPQTNITEVASGAPEGKRCIKHIQASEDMLRMASLGLCIVSGDSYFVFFTFAIKPVDHGSWEFVDGSYRSLILNSFSCEMLILNLQSFSVVRSWGSWIPSFCFIMGFWILTLFCTGILRILDPALGSLVFVVPWSWILVVLDHD